MSRSAEPAIEKADLLKIYRGALTVRLFEANARRLLEPTQLLRWDHLGRGEEIVVAGAMAAIERDDYAVTTGGGDNLSVARGRNLSGVMAEIAGRSTGFSRGKAGPDGAFGWDTTVLGGFSKARNSISIGLGTALAARVLGNERVTVAFLRDGEFDHGVIRDGLNLAFDWCLPLVFVWHGSQRSIFGGQYRVAKTRGNNGPNRYRDLPLLTVDGME